MGHQNIEFSKLSGSGNDFICIDNQDGSYDHIINNADFAKAFASAMCQRAMGVGADGLIFACVNEVEDFADVAARFFEADGSGVELCGNGVACFTKWASEMGFANKPEMRILTCAGVVRGSIMADGYVKVCIPFPEHMLRDERLIVCGRNLTFDYAVTGVPHVVTYVDCLDSLDMGLMGPAIRHHEHFAPRGTNANFVQVRGPGEFAVRTYEFGVEAETHACGTGSATAALMAAKHFAWPEQYTNGDQPILATARSGDVLKIWITLDDNEEVIDLCIETVVRSIYKGSVNAEFAAGNL